LENVAATLQSSVSQILQLCTQSLLVIKWDRNIAGIDVLVDQETTAHSLSYFYISRNYF